MIRLSAAKNARRSFQRHKRCKAHSPGMIRNCGFSSAAKYAEDGDRPGQASRGLFLRVIAACRRLRANQPLNRNSLAVTKMTEPVSSVQETKNDMVNTRRILPSIPAAGNSFHTETVESAAENRP